MNALKGLGKSDGDKPEDNKAEETTNTESTASDATVNSNPNLAPGTAFAKSAPASDENEPKGEESQEEAEKMAERASADEGDADVRAATLTTPADEGVTYTSHPISRFKIGRFQFEKGTLVLKDQDDIDEFKKLMAGATPRDQATVRKIDVSGAEQLARKFKEGSMTRGVDTSTTDNNAPKA